MWSDFISQFSWVDIKAFLENILPDVWEWLRSMLSSYPVLFVIIGILGYGVIKSAVKVAVTAGVCLLIWLGLRSLGFDFSMLQGLIPT